MLFSLVFETLVTLTIWLLNFIVSICIFLTTISSKRHTICVHIR